MKKLLILMLSIVWTFSQAQHLVGTDVKLVGGSSSTAGTVNGTFYFDTGSGLFQFRQGGSWTGLGGGGTPGGSNLQMQYNNSGALGGIASFTNSSGNPLVSGNFFYDQNNGNNAGGTAYAMRSTQGGTYGDFAIAGNDTNFGDAEFDFIATMGINMAAGGGRIISGKGALGIQMERHFNGISSDDFEFHIKQMIAGGAAPVEVRYFSFNARKDNGQAQAFFSFQSIDFRDVAGTSYANLNNNGQLRLTGSSAPQLTLNSSADGTSNTLNYQSGAITFTNASSGLPPSWSWNTNYAGAGGNLLLKNSNASATTTLAYQLQAGTGVLTWQLTPHTGFGTITDCSYWINNISGKGFVWQSGGNANYDLAVNQGNMSLGVETTTNAMFYILGLAKSSAWKPLVRWDPAANTALTAATAFPDINITGATQTWLAGTIAIQPKMWIQANTINTGTATVAAALQLDPWVVGTGTITNNYTLYSNGKIGFPFTYTAGGTNGNQTINKPSGSLNIAAAGTTVTLTNSFITTNSVVLPVLMTADATAFSVKSAVVTSGQVVFTLNAACTGAVQIGFVVIN